MYLRDDTYLFIIYLWFSSFTIILKNDFVICINIILRWVVDITQGFLVIVFRSIAESTGETMGHAFLIPSFLWSTCIGF